MNFSNIDLKELASFIYETLKKAGTYPRILNIAICDDFSADFASKEEGYLEE